MLSKEIFVPLTICIDQTRRALVVVLPCYSTLEIVGVIIIIIIGDGELMGFRLDWKAAMKDACRGNVNVVQKH